ncbi:MAG: ATP-dependent helicase [Deltaproteobacteria bacterium]|nr:ATP-dependent helicase [Deltaproteobacteria bacterium]
MTQSNHDDRRDDHIDKKIETCLDITNPQSFFIFAGAGSGKTRSLIKAVQFALKKYRRSFQVKGRKICVITFTNAAVGVINLRTNYDPMVSVSTIHSFVWGMIQGYNQDIRVSLEKSIKIKIEELDEKEKKGRGGDASIKRLAKIKFYEERLAKLPLVKEFRYSPEDLQKDIDFVTHADVIRIGAEFLLEFPLMRQQLISRFPILLIDESQDTHKQLLEALIATQKAHSDQFVLGLFGDAMQQIYLQGLAKIETEIGSDWLTLDKVMNHRSNVRVVDLANAIRKQGDKKKQEPRSDKTNGFIRLFLAPNDADRQAIESSIYSKMAKITEDIKWDQPNEQVKSLVIEHHMAAHRMGFSRLFNVLRLIPDIYTELLGGSVRQLRVFSDQILPLKKALSSDDDFKVMNLLKEHSPLLRPEALKSGRSSLEQAKKACDELNVFWNNNPNPSFFQVLQKIKKSKLFSIPFDLDHFLDSAELEPPSHEEQELPPRFKVEEGRAWELFLLSEFNQIQPYKDYISGDSSFDTHQGVKGREFERVLAIIDDGQARGFLFDYEKLFGAKPPSPTDLKNTSEGKETSVDRTTRLFYVICTRAEQSLAVVAYTSNPRLVREKAIQADWFLDEEIINL